MTAGLRQYLMLAGIGLAGGFGTSVAILGPGELMKRATAVVSPEEAPRTLADKPGEAAPAPEGKQAGDKPSADKQAALPPAESVEKQAAKEPAKPGKPLAEEAPSLDIVRVEPNGDAVIAGRTTPKAEIEILRDDKPIARVKADETGQFAIVPPTLPTGNSEISYRSVAPDGKETKGRESVAIVVAENRATKPLVAVSTPDKPTVVLSQPETPAAAAPEQKTVEARQAEAKKALAGKAEPKEKQHDKAQEKPQRLTALPETKAAAGDKPSPVKVVSIDAQEGGRLDVSGVARPGATLRLYLNDTLVASGKAGPDGKLAFTIGRGVKPGGYQVRIDQVEPDTGKVENRAQVAFAFPESAAPKLASRETSPAAATPPPLPARPDADKKPAGALAERTPSTRDGNAAAGASPPPAPAAEARTASRQAEAAKPGPSKLEAPPQRQWSNAEPEKKEPPSVAAAPLRPETPAAADRRVADTASPKPSGAAPDKPAASDKPSEQAAAPEKKESSPVAATARKPDPAPEPDKRMAEAPAPKPSAPGPQGEAASPSGNSSTTPLAAPSEPADGMKNGATASVTPEPKLEPAPSDKPGTVFVPEISTAKITRGDNLWHISRRTYGNGLRYTVIFDANKDQIRDPDLIYPGQIFVLPKDEVGAKRG